MRFLQSLGLLPMSHQARETCNTNFESENLPSSCCSQSVDLDTGFQLLNGKKTKDLDRHLPWKQSKAFASLHDKPFLLGSGWVDLGESERVFYLQLKKPFFLLNSFLNKGPSLIKRGHIQRVLSIFIQVTEEVQNSVPENEQGFSRLT